MALRADVTDGQEIGRGDLAFEKYFVLLCVGQPVFDVQVGVAKKFEGVAVPIIGTGFGYHIDLAAGIVAVFGVEVIGDDSEFGDGIEIRNGPGTRKTSLLHENSVQKETVRSFAHAIDGVSAGVLIAGNCWRRKTGRSKLAAQTAVHARLLRDDPGLEWKQVRIATSVEGHVGHMLPGNDFAHLRAGGIHVQGETGHFNHFGSLAALQGDIDDQRRVDVNDDTSLLVRLEALLFDLDGVGPDRQRLEGIKTRGVCLLGGHNTGAGISCGYSGAGNCRAGGVRNCAGDTRGDSRIGKSSSKQQEQKEWK